MKSFLFTAIALGASAVAIAPVSAQRIGGSPPVFFETGNDRFQQEINRLSSPETEPTLTVDTAPSWQPLVSKSGGFSILMPPGVHSQEDRKFETTLGTLDFDVTNVDADDSRYVAAYSNRLSKDLRSDPKALFSALQASIIATTDYALESEREIQSGVAPGREVTLRGSDRVVVLQMYLLDNRLAVIGAREPETSPTAKTFLGSFKPL